MDALKSCFLSPLHSILSNLQVIIGVVIVILPLTLRLFRRGISSLRRFSDIFEFLHPLPLGDSLFLFIVWLYTPYTTSIHPIVQKLDESYCIAMIEDRPWLRNPFHSIHAAALVNLGEFTTGLAVMSAMQYNRKLRGIPKRLEISFLKKARGRITGVSHVNLADIDEDCERVFESMLLDSKAEEVARFKVTWAIRCIKQKL
eukprot:gene288-522_t